MNEPINIWQTNPCEIIPGFHGRFVHSDNATIAYWEIDAQAVLPEHQHHHEQVVHLLSGEFELTVAGKIINLTPGDVLLLQPHIPHAGRAITDCRIMDVFNPCRDDYRQN